MLLAAGKGQQCRKADHLCVFGLLADAIAQACPERDRAGPSGTARDRSTQTDESHMQHQRQAYPQTESTSPTLDSLGRQERLRVLRAEIAELERLESESAFSRAGKRACEEEADGNDTERPRTTDNHCYSGASGQEHKAARKRG